MCEFFRLQLVQGFKSVVYLSIELCCSTLSSVLPFYLRLLIFAYLYFVYHIGTIVCYIGVFQEFWEVTAVVVVVICLACV